MIITGANGESGGKTSSALPLKDGDQDLEKVPWRSRLVHEPQPWGCILTLPEDRFDRLHGADRLVSR
jgi:hypothetical protein